MCVWVYLAGFLLEKMKKNEAINFILILVFSMFFDFFVLKMNDNGLMEAILLLLFHFNSVLCFFFYHMAADELRSTRNEVVEPELDLRPDECGFCVW